MGDSITTKQNLSDAVKQLSQTKPFAKISVSDVSDACGITRQAFYYHFNDKYDLLAYLYRADFKDATADITLQNWPQMLLLLLQKMEKERRFYNTVAKEDTACFPALLHSWVFTFLAETLPQLPPYQGMDAEQLVFTAKFYAYGLCHTILIWAQNNMPENAEQLVRRVRAMAAFNCGSRT